MLTKEGGEPSLISYNLSRKRKTHTHLKNNPQEGKMGRRKANSDLHTHTYLLPGGHKVNKHCLLWGLEVNEGMGREKTLKNPQPFPALLKGTDNCKKHTHLL
jgi:hypothetical protein